MNNIIIDGQEYPVKFGGQAVERLLSKMNYKTVEQLGLMLQKWPISKLSYLIKAGIENGILAMDMDTQAPDMEAVKLAVDKDFSLGMEVMQWLAADITPKSMEAEEKPLSYSEELKKRACDIAALYDKAEFLNAYYIALEEMEAENVKKLARESQIQADKISSNNKKKAKTHTVKN